MVKTSVLVIAYQHEPYIAQCLESVLSQNTSDFEIVIGEDGSTDRTSEICESYRSKYPNKIRLFRRERRDVISICGKETGRRNLIDSWQQTRGEYVALIEGDDYWVDKDKLQTQADFLDKNTDYSICATNLEHRDRVGTLVGYRFESGRKHEFDVSLFLRGHTAIATSTVMIRRDSLREFPAWFFGHGAGDWGLFVMATLSGGKGVVLPVISAVYRIHSGGIYSGASILWRLLLSYDGLAAVEGVVTGRLLRMARRSRRRLYPRLAYQYMRCGNCRKFIVTALRSALNPISAVDSILKLIAARRRGAVAVFDFQS